MRLKIHIQRKKKVSLAIIKSLLKLLLDVYIGVAAPHSSTLAWRIPWTEEPGRLQSTGSRRVGHDWATSLSLFTFMHWRRKWQPTPVFLPGESQGQGSLVGCHLWVAQSRTRLKRLSSSSSNLGMNSITFGFVTKVKWFPMGSESPLWHASSSLYLTPAPYLHSPTPFLHQPSWCSLNTSSLFLPQSYLSFPLSGSILPTS